MAHPKHRISKQRKRKRRTHYKIEAPNVASCNNCGAPKLRHHICPECGFHRGRLIIKPVMKELAAAPVDTNDLGED